MLSFVSLKMLCTLCMWAAAAQLQNNTLAVIQVHLKKFEYGEKVIFFL